MIEREEDIKNKNENMISDNSSEYEQDSDDNDNDDDDNDDDDDDDDAQEIDSNEENSCENSDYDIDDEDNDSNDYDSNSYDSNIYDSDEYDYDDNINLPNPELICLPVGSLDSSLSSYKPRSSLTSFKPENRIIGNTFNISLPINDSKIDIIPKVKEVNPTMGIKKKSDQCKDLNCLQRASFNFPGKTGAMYCARHKHPDMKNTRSDSCQQDDCWVRATYNFAGIFKAKYCKEHRLQDMKPVTYDLRCKSPNCRKIAYFNYFKDNKDIKKSTEMEENEVDTKILGIFCSTHKEPGMVDVKTPRCIFENCIEFAKCNVTGEIQAKYCPAHKKPGMAEVKYKRCEEEGCAKYASYNHENESKPKYCVVHKEIFMVVKNSKKCSKENCGKKSSFNYPNKADPIYCAEHKLEGMENFLILKCEFGECKKTATSCKESSVEGDDKKVIRYCNKHLLEIDNGGVKKKDLKEKNKHKKALKVKDIMRHSIDNNNCKYVNEETGQFCINLATYGFKADKDPVFCSKHKNPKMENKISSKKCEYKDCRKMALFNYPGLEKKFCNIHKESEMINLKKVPCSFNRGDASYSGCDKDATHYNALNPNECLCYIHKLTRMLPLKNKKCEFSTCKEKAVCGDFDDEIKCCRLHKTDSMEEAISNFCNYNNCTLEAYHGLAADNIAIRCNLHAAENMITLSYRRCSDGMCNKIAGFNYIANTKQPKYCGLHIRSGMIDVSGMVCSFYDCRGSRCKNTALFNHESILFPVVCSSHIQVGMDYLYTRPICMYQNCNKKALYSNKKHTEPLYCEEHQYILKKSFTIKNKSIEEIIKLNNQTFCNYKTIGINSHATFCSQTTTYYDDKTLLRYCKAHYKEGMTELVFGIDHAVHKGNTVSYKIFQEEQKVKKLLDDLLILKNNKEYKKSELSPDCNEDEYGQFKYNEPPIESELNNDENEIGVVKEKKKNNNIEHKFFQASNPTSAVTDVQAEEEEEGDDNDEHIDGESDDDDDESNNNKNNNNNTYYNAYNNNGFDINNSINYSYTDTNGNNTGNNNGYNNGYNDNKDSNLVINITSTVTNNNNNNNNNNSQLHYKNNNSTSGYNQENNHNLNNNYHQNVFYPEPPFIQKGSRKPIFENTPFKSSYLKKMARKRGDDELRVIDRINKPRLSSFVPAQQTFEKYSLQYLGDNINSEDVDVTTVSNTVSRSGLSSFSRDIKPHPALTEQDDKIDRILYNASNPAPITRLGGRISSFAAFTSRVN